jgi:hypothetical protein
MKDNPFGVWVSASSMASVQLIFDKKKKNTVTFKGKIYVGFSVFAYSFYFLVANVSSL